MHRTDGDTGARVFDPAIRLLHWLTLLLIVAIFVLAWAIGFAASKPQIVMLTQLHRSLGLTVWVVTLVRLGWRQIARLPDWPASMPTPMRIAARGSESALYLLLLTQPVLGLLQSNARGDRVDLFFLGTLPALIGPDRPLARQLLAAHSAVGLGLLALIALHAAAALYHHFWRRDDTLTSMLPQRRLKPSPAAGPIGAMPCVPACAAPQPDGLWHHCAGHDAVARGTIASSRAGCGR